MDSGITSHADLNDKILPGYDMISDPRISRDRDGRDNDPTDMGDWTYDGTCGRDSRAANSSWHGTHVAGIAAAITDNHEGVAGVAPDERSFLSVLWGDAAVTPPILQTRSCGPRARTFPALLTTTTPPT
ncbi:S8 family serine peptidase [Corynebacterium silvaticum]|uniref:S8 family serine peptidase n=1 Tax=Corynebacterium silvaticum TaxID=2320431 RepID=A0ACD4PXZ4_9CORY|nr:S8 family serine peptidase [Corynebacterium silvaticum]WCV10574.1 S8 family serine peptidase [Corynebacterium silvaticum]